MTLIIENVKDEFVPAFRDLAKSAKSKIKTKRSDKEIAEEWRRESEELMRDYKAGKIKGYDDIDEMFEAIRNEV
ncbi:hypothetical protein [Helicobacter sp. 11S02596-1]|uniref:hypothetical protein n=1 Tax=Helicobacter sp. 11S02596-1 TaxID=1476194 RepID=UPI000BA75F32|nr:hypothetical protein [Helicobacter sp. 11S02596-1]PAF41130.1 hypothetical protein BJI48_09050 [Helicobacter sp. 11S02596-1]